MLVNAVSNNNVSFSSAESGSGRGNVISNRTEAAAPLLAETNSRQPNLAAVTATAGSNSSAAPQQTAERNSESVRVSSSIGRAASAGQLTREQALEIYRNIARFL